MQTLAASLCFHRDSLVDVCSYRNKKPSFFLLRWLQNKKMRRSALLQFSIKVAALTHTHNEKLKPNQRPSSHCNSPPLICISHHCFGFLKPNQTFFAQLRDLISLLRFETLPVPFLCVSASSYACPPLIATNCLLSACSSLKRGALT